jgi:hypothetical protein
MQLPHFHVHVHVEDVKIIIKLTLITKVHLFWSTLYNYVTMRGTKHIKFATDRQAKQIHQYENIKGKLYMTNTSICYTKTCRVKQLTPNYISIQGVPYM